MTNFLDLLNGLSKAQREVMSADDIGQAAHTAPAPTRKALIDRHLIKMVKRENDNGDVAELTDLGTEIREALHWALTETGSMDVEFQEGDLRHFRPAIETPGCVLDLDALDIPRGVSAEDLGTRDLQNGPDLTHQRAFGILETALGLQNGLIPMDIAGELYAFGRRQDWPPAEAFFREARAALGGPEWTEAHADVQLFFRLFRGIGQAVCEAADVSGKAHQEAMRTLAADMQRLEGERRRARRGSAFRKKKAKRSKAIQDGRKARAEAKAGTEEQN